MEGKCNDKGDTKRKSRNLSEKKRRDTFNNLVNELSSVISTNCTSNHKLDKSSILKSTISFLKAHNELTAKSRAHDVQKDWKPTYLSNEEFTYLVLEALEGFVIVFSATGHIYYVSESIKTLLGHNPADLMNKSIFDLTFEEDQTSLYNLLQNPRMSFNASQPLVRDNQIRFQCHLRRSTLDFRDGTEYELIQFNGHFRTNLRCINADTLQYQQELEPGMMFVCTGRLKTPKLIRDVSLVDPNRCEFISRHSLEWKFLFLDHRAPPIIGYLPFEVLGTSGYDYYHFDDLEKIVTCHEALMQKGEVTSCYYRFLTKGQQWIWLQTRFYITYHQWNAKPEFVVCSHRVVSYEDVVKNTKQEDTEVEVVSETENVLTIDIDNKDTPHKETTATVSLIYTPETTVAFVGSYNPIPQAASVKPVSAGSISATVTTMTAATTTDVPRPCHSSYRAVSDRPSLSSETSTSQRNSICVAPRTNETTLAPQHGIGAQYLDPAPYVSAVRVSDAIGTQVSSVSTVAVPASDQTQMQCKHVQLEEMIERQQEELRQVKEQLLLARLGILQPLINVPNGYVGAQNNVQHIQRIPAQIVYDGTQAHIIPGFPQQHPPSSTGHYQ